MDQRLRNYRTRESLDTQLQAQLTAGQYGLIAGGPQRFITDAGPLAFQRLYYSPLSTGAAAHLIDVDLSVDGQQFPFWSESSGLPIELHALCTASGPIPQPIGTCPETIFGPGSHVVRVQLGAHLLVRSGGTCSESEHAEGCEQRLLCDRAPDRPHGKAEIVQPVLHRGLDLPNNSVQHRGTLEFADSHVLQRIVSVAEVGLEPTRPCGHRILSPARLPVPPLGQQRAHYTYFCRPR
jgi:hypothetical protein